MRTKSLAYLLQAVKLNGDVDQLLGLGYTYQQIAQFIIELENSGYLINSEEGLVLTEKGIHKLKEVNERMEKFYSYTWIRPEESSKIKKIKVSDVYLPDKDNLKL